MNHTLGILALITLTGSIAVFIAMVSYLIKKGEKIKWIFIKLYMPVYIYRYKKLKQQAGEPLTLFNLWVILINSTLILAVLGLVLKN